jgi:fructoselysine 6-kinase
LRLLAIGDNCVDDYRELGMRFPGGNALNVAAYAHRIPGVEAEYIGVVGTDEAGSFILDEMRREGLSTDGVIRLTGSTVVTAILIRGGDRIFSEYAEGVQKDAVFPEGLLPKVSRYDLVHFTVWGFGREHIPDLKETSGSTLSCDFSNQLDHPSTGAMPWLDYSFFSGKELIGSGLSPEERLVELKMRTPGVVVMTLGEHGSIACDGKRLYRGEAEDAEVVDTLGAGDAYIAAFLCSRQRGASIQEAIRSGHRAAAEICGRLGAWGG